MEISVRKPWDRILREIIVKGHSQTTTYPEWMQMCKVRKKTNAIDIRPIDRRLRFGVYPTKNISVLEDGRNKKHTRFKIR